MEQDAAGRAMATVKGRWDILFKFWKVTARRLTL
jgi:hypothetical protein